MRGSQNETPTEMLPVVQNITISGTALEPKPGTVTLADLFAKVSELVDLLKTRST
jgi:hypothetical protein